MDESKETTTNAAVQHEHIRKTHEEKMHEVVDKERHQDHFHTTVQPLKDSEVKPEEHNYKEGATENRSFNHEDSAETKAKLEAEKARFQNTVSEGSTAESKTNEGVVAGEDKIIHHHHEIIQPVIEKGKSSHSLAVKCTGKLTIACNRDREAFGYSHYHSRQRDSPGPFCSSWHFYCGADVC